MADYSDVLRARLGAKMTLGAAEFTGTSDVKSGDTDLRDLLEDIRGRQFVQTTRLMRWLEGHDPGAAKSQDRLGGNATADFGSATYAPATPDSASASPRGEFAPADEYATQPAISDDSNGGSVTDIIHVSPELIRFRVSRPADFDFKAGQSVKIGLGDVRRSYSIVSAPHEPFLEFFVELVPGGSMSERLRHLSMGDRVSVGAAKGGLRFDQTCPEQVMIATVTGINPFISMVRDYFYHKRSGHRFHILQGASYQGEFGYHDELFSLAAAHPDVIRYVPTVSRPAAAANASWTGQTGRVDVIVSDYTVENGLHPETTSIYVCGHEGMIDTVASHYRAARFPVRTESYD